MALGGCTVEELQGRMAYAEFVEWMAFASVEPLPQARADLHTALLMYLIASTNRKKGDKRLKLEKFVLDFWASSSRDPRALERKFRAMTGNVETADEPSVNGVSTNVRRA